MKTKLFPAAVVALGLLVLGACIAFLADHRATTSEFITEVTTENFDAEVLKSTTPVYVEFTVSGKCDQCAAQAPIVDKLAAEYKGRVHFVRIDARKSPELARGAGLRGVPTHFLMNPAEDVGIKAEGVLDEAGLRAFIDKGLTMKKPVAPPAAAPDTTGAPTAPAAPAAPKN